MPRVDFEPIAALAAPVLVLFSGFVPYVRYHDYGLMNAEIGVCLAILGGAALKADLQAFYKRWGFDYTAVRTASTFGPTIRWEIF